MVAKGPPGSSGFQLKALRTDDEDLRKNHYNWALKMPMIVDLFLNQASLRKPEMDKSNLCSGQYYRAN